MIMNLTLATPVPGQRPPTGQRQSLSPAPAGQSNPPIPPIGGMGIAIPPILQNAEWEPC